MKHSEHNGTRKGKAAGDVAFSRVVSSGRGQKAASPTAMAGWERKSFNDCFATLSTRGHQIQTKQYLPSGRYPVVDQGETQFVGFSNDESKVLRCPKGGVIVFGDHTRNVKFINEDFVVGADGTKLLVSRDDSTEFLFNLLLNTRIPNTGYNRHFKFLQSLSFSIPPISTQHRITAILSSCDRVVEGKQKLLEAKKRRKRALMRMLLEQENESASQNASPGKWPRIPFEDCFKLLRNNTYSRAFMVPTEGVANIHYGDVLVKYGEFLDIAAGDVVSLAVGTPPNGDFLQEGDVVIADTAEDETCGKAVEIGRLGSRKAVAGLHTIACRPKQGLFVAGWLGFFLNSAAYHRQLVPLMAGIKVLSLARSSLQTTKIGVPPLAEQRRIVAILSAAGREIAGLAREVEAWKEKKKALSQLLLSGKVRV